MPCRIFRAAAINPGDPTSNLNVGAYEQGNGNPQKAVEYYLRVLRSRIPAQRQGHGHQQLGESLRRTGHRRPSATSVG